MVTVDFTQLLVGFAATIAACILILLTESKYANYSVDDSNSPQKIHIHKASRVGGIALFVGLLAAAIVGDNADNPLLILSLFALLPVFMFGLGEDFTKNVSPRLRLVASLVTGVAFLWAFDVRLSKTGFDFSDQLLAFAPLALFLTAIAIATLVNAVNVIDGLNGLSIGSSIFMLGATAIISWHFGDGELTQLACVLVACLVGVALFNFPHGRLFMGDSGAYVMGGFAAFCAILISERNAEISPFFSLLLVAYPFYELMRTIVRRARMSEANVMAPDLKHLHSVMFTYMQMKGLSTVRANVSASCRVLMLPLISCLWAMAFPANTVMLIVGICGMVVMYETLYRLHALD